MKTHNARFASSRTSLARRKTFRGPGGQRGAVLFVALMMIIIFSLLGLASMQVTLLQERMSGNYRTANLAFQNAETQVRRAEAQFERAINSGGSLPSNMENCAQFDVDAWARPNTLPTTGQVFTKRIDKCFTYGSRKAGVPDNKSASNIYQISGIDFDRDTDRSALVVVETVYVP